MIFRNFGQKSKFWSKMEILFKNRNFGQKSKFWSKIEVLAKHRNFGQKSKIWSKIEILVKNRNFGHTCTFLPTIQIFGLPVKIFGKPTAQIYGQKSGETLGNIFCRENYYYRFLKGLLWDIFLFYFP